MIFQGEGQRNDDDGMLAYEFSRRGPGEVSRRRELIANLRKQLVSYGCGYRSCCHQLCQLCKCTVSQSSASLFLLIIGPSGTDKTAKVCRFNKYILQVGAGLLHPRSTAVDSSKCTL